MTSSDAQRRLQILQNVSTELRRRDRRPTYLDDYRLYVEVLERVASGEKSGLTLQEQKRVYVLQASLTTVYFLAAVDAGKVKIGKTLHLQKRLANLRTANAGELELLTAVRYDSHLEARIHAHLAEYRSHGGWFHADAPVVDFIRGVRDGGVEWVVEQVGDAPPVWVNSLDNLSEELRLARVDPNLELSI